MERIVYEQHEHTAIIDNETGEVKKEKKTHVKEVRIEKEPDYIKLYLDHLGRFNDVPISFNPILRELLKNISYANSDEDDGMILFLNKALKSIIAKKLNVSLARVNQAVTEFVKKGYMKRIDRGAYQFNPFLFGKGEWKDIRAIRATYNYNTGEVKADIIKENDEKEVEIIGICPNCGNDIIKDVHGIRCKENCGFKISPNDLSEEEIKSLLNKHIVEQVGKDYKMIIFPEIISENGMYYWKKKIQLLQVKEDKITTEQTKEPTEQIQNQNKEKSTKILGKCPNCGNNILWGKYGAYCAGGCGVNVSRIYGVYLTKEQVQALLNGKSISYTANGWKNTVFPEIENHVHNGKTTPEWKRKSEKI